MSEERNCWPRHPCNIYQWWQKNRSVYQSNEWTTFNNKEVEPVEPVQMNIIYQSNTYNRDLSWLHYFDEPRVQRQQMKDQQSCIFAFVAYLAIQSSN